jgi:hypothetical protein
VPPSSTRRSPRVARPPAPVIGSGRPTAVPFAAAFGLLVAAEDGYLAWLLWGTSAAYVVAALLLAAVAVAGAGLTFAGRGRGWLVLTLASVLPLLALLVLVLLVGVLGAGSYVALALLLLLGPIGCLVLALQRPVRAWTGPRRADRSAGGRRPRAASR